jgi:hypothetical protein
MTYVTSPGEKEGGEISLSFSPFSGNRRGGKGCGSFTCASGGSGRIALSPLEIRYLRFIVISGYDLDIFVIESTQGGPFFKKVSRRMDSLKSLTPCRKSNKAVITFVG